MNRYKKLRLVRQKAKALNIQGEISVSNHKQKKYMITLKNGKIIHFGYNSMEDYLDHNDEKRRKNFRARFRNNKGVNDVNSPLYYSYRLLW